jgi:hypothetical protein
MHARRRCRGRIVAALGERDRRGLPAPEALHPIPDRLPIGLEGIQGADQAIADPLEVEAMARARAVVVEAGLGRGGGGQRCQREQDGRWVIVESRQQTRSA